MPNNLITPKTAMISLTRFSKLMETGYPPIDIKFTDRIFYYNAFDEYHVRHNPGAMERLFAEYVNKRFDSYLVMLDM